MVNMMRRSHNTNINTF